MSDAVVGDFEMRGRNAKVSPGARGFEEIALPRVAAARRDARGSLPLGRLGLSPGVVADLPRVAALPVVATADVAALAQPTRAVGWSALAAYIVAASRALRSMAARALVSWRRRRVLRATRRALSELDDHMLHDMGWSRPEIDSIARELAGSSEPTRERSATCRGPT